MADNGWHVERVWWNGILRNQVWDADDTVLATVGVSPRMDDVANKMAAAPDLLALAEAIIAEADTGGDLDWHLQESGLAEMARAAVAKVKGEG